MLFKRGKREVGTRDSERRRERGESRLRRREGKSAERARMEGLSGLSRTPGKSAKRARREGLSGRRRRPGKSAISSDDRRRGCPEVLFAIGGFCKLHEILLKSIKQSL